MACLKVLYENIFYDLVLTKSQKMYLKIPMLVFQIQNVFSFSTATIVKTEKIFVIFVENIGEINWWKHLVNQSIFFFRWMCSLCLTLWLWNLWSPCGHWDRRLGSPHVFTNSETLNLFILLYARYHKPLLIASRSWIQAIHNAKSHST